MNFVMVTPSSLMVVTRSSICGGRPTACLHRRLIGSIYLMPAGRLAANPPVAVAAVNREERRTDGRTDVRALHRPCSCCYAGNNQSHVKTLVIMLLQVIGNGAVK